MLRANHCQDKLAGRFSKLLIMLDSSGNIISSRDGQPIFRREGPGTRSYWIRVREGQITQRIRVRAGLGAITRFIRIKGIKYLTPFEAADRVHISVHRDRATSPIDKCLIEETQTAEVTLKRKGGDCDDLSLLYAYLLLRRLRKDPNLEFGVVYGYVRLRTTDEERYGCHAMLAVRDKRRPDIFLFFDVSNIESGPQYAGNFIAGVNNSAYPTPQSNPYFVINTYVPAKANGTIDLSSSVCFISQRGR